MMPGCKPRLYKLNSNGELTVCPFSKCLLETFGSYEDQKMDSMKMCVTELASPGTCCGHRLVLHMPDQLVSEKNRGAQTSPLLFRHSTMCALKAGTSTSLTLPTAHTLDRGVDIGVVIVLESRNEKGERTIFLTQRSKSLRTFPGRWVPPGGHMECGETLVQAGLRELEEETGLCLRVKPTEAEVGESYEIKWIRPLALWESVNPYAYSIGPPLQQHLIIYLHALCSPHISVPVLRSRLKLCPVETEAACFLTQTQIGLVFLKHLTPENLASSGIAEGLKTVEVLRPHSNTKTSSSTFSSINSSTSSNQVVSTAISSIASVTKSEPPHATPDSGTRHAIHDQTDLTGYTIDQVPISNFKSAGIGRQEENIEYISMATEFALLMWYKSLTDAIPLATL